MLLKFVAKRTPKLRYPLVKVRRYTTAKAETEHTQIEQLRTDVTTLQVSMAQVQKQLQEIGHVLSHSHTKYDKQGNTKQSLFKTTEKIIVIPETKSTFNRIVDFIAEVFIAFVIFIMCLVLCVLALFLFLCSRS